MKQYYLFLQGFLVGSRVSSGSLGPLSSFVNIILVVGPALSHYMDLNVIGDIPLFGEAFNTTKTIWVEPHLELFGS